MELKLRDILNAKPSIEQLLSLSPAPIASVAFIIARNARKISQALVSFDKTQKALLIKYGEQTKDGYVVPDDKIEAFKSEMEDLLDQVTNVDIETIAYAQLEESDQRRTNFEIPAMALYSAWFMFEGIEDGPTPPEEENEDA